MLMFFTGCGLYKPYSRPTDAAALMNDDDTLTLRWQQLFTDPALQALVDSVLTHNTDLQIASLRVYESAQSLRTARLTLLPSLNASADVSTPDFAAFGGSLGATLSWQPDLFFGQTNAARKARAAWAESDYNRQAVRTRLIANVVGLYYSRALLLAQRNVAAESAQLWEQTIEKTRAMKDAGMVTDVALAQYEATYLSTLSTLEDYDYNLHLTENAIRSLIGTPDYTMLDSETSFMDFNNGKWKAENGKLIINYPLSIINYQSLPLLRLAARPDVRIAEEQLKQAYYATAVARAAFYPTLRLTGNAASDFSLSAITTHVAASLAQPVFNAATNLARYRIARAQQQEALLRFSQTLCDAALETDNILHRLHTAQAQAEHLAGQVTALERAAANTEWLMQYGSTSTTYLDVLTARRSLLTAQLAQLANRYAQLDALISLYTALGGQ
ncbi:MAG: TolC family protein [Bacteroidaceae bacterium]|nr:TolC family protein [Bacteroidaceae bacterium]